MLNKDEINSRLKKSIQGKIPKLKCIVSGLERSTSMDYLKTKEEKFGSIENFTKHYISSEAVKLLKQDNNIIAIKDILNPTQSHIPDESIINEAKKYYGL